MRSRSPCTTGFHLPLAVSLYRLRASTTGGMPGSVLTADACTAAGAEVASGVPTGALACARTDGIDTAAPSAVSNRAATNANEVRLDTLVTGDWGLIVI